MGTAAAFLACYCPLCLSAPGKPSDPGIPSKFLPAEPGIRQGASRRSHVLVHVDPRAALEHNFHARPPPAAAPPTRWEQARRPPEPRSVQETDTRARSSNGGYPGRGSGANLSDGLERSKAKRRRRAARHLNCAPSAPAAATRSPQRPQPPPTRTTPDAGGDPVLVSHGSATQWTMISKCNLRVRLEPSCATLRLHQMPT